MTAYWNNAVGNICWNKVWMLPHTYLLTNKVKEISYKIINKFYPAKHYMKKKKKVTFPPVAFFVMTLLKRLSISFGTVHLQRNFGKMLKVSLGVTFIRNVFCFGRT